MKVCWWWSNSIPWCTSFRLILSLRTWCHYLFHALVIKPWTGMLSHLSEFRGFCFHEYRFSLYSLCFQGEFHCYSEGFYLCFVGLSESICKWRRALILMAVASLPADELFAGAGVRSPVLIWISSSCDITVNSQDSVIFQAC